jgi:hypothetical protein
MSPLLSKLRDRTTAFQPLARVSKHLQVLFEALSLYPCFLHQRLRTLVPTNDTNQCQNSRSSLPTNPLRNLIPSPSFNPIHPDDAPTQPNQTSHHTSPHNSRSTKSPPHRTRSSHSCAFQTPVIQPPPALILQRCQLRYCHSMFPLPCMRATSATARRSILTRLL